MKKVDAKEITLSLIKWLDKHNDSKVITTEISINTSIGVKVADVVMSNGHLVAYEVKSELDNTLRLENQINGYSEIFDYVYIVYWGAKFSLDELNLPKHVGAIEAYYDREQNIIFTVRNRAYKNYQLDTPHIAKMLWKNELFYYLDKKNVEVKRSACKDILCDLFEMNYSKRESLQIIKNVFKGRFDKGFTAFKQASSHEDALQCLIKNKQNMNYLDALR